jgi:RNA polymerase sigma-70 factor (ECF subfamily)
VIEDAQLIDEALAGNKDAFGQLVLRYQNRLFNTVVHVVGCRSAAEDVVQDAFVQAFVKLETFQRASAFYTWLYRIAVNLAISHRRRKRPELSVEAQRESGSHNEPIDASEGPTDPVEREERIAQVHQAMNVLNDEHRAVLVLREMEGLCYERIAEILDLPVGTVRSRLHRARIQLRERLQQVLGSASS